MAYINKTAQHISGSHLASVQEYMACFYPIKKEDSKLTVLYLVLQPYGMLLVLCARDTRQSQGGSFPICLNATPHKVALDSVLCYHTLSIC